MEVKHKELSIKLSEAWNKDMNKGQGAQQEHTLGQTRRGRLHTHTHRHTRGGWEQVETVRNQETQPRDLLFKIRQDLRRWHYSTHKA